MLTNGEISELNKYGWKYLSKTDKEVIYTNNADNTNFFSIVDLLIKNNNVDYQVEPEKRNKATLKISKK